MGKRIVIALGGNALGSTPYEQLALVTETAKPIVDLIEQGNEVVIAHGNGPQVGMINLGMATAAEAGAIKSDMPFPECGAMSQGYIGYDLQNGIRTELIKRGIFKPVSTVLTQVTVDPYDESSYTPVKKVGRIMTAEEAAAEEAKGNYVTEVPGKGFQRMVAAPKPVAIVEIDAIKTLLDADQLVIACGGGGIPVMEQGHSLKGASAIIEKDMVSGLLAKEVDADVLMILTDVDCVSLNYGKAEEKPLSAKEQETLLAIADGMVNKIALPCTACRYCTSHCPQGLDIPGLLALYNEHCFTGGGFLAPMALSAIPKDKWPSACVGCHSCEAVCPQQIRISEAMADFTSKLEG